MRYFLLACLGSLYLLLIGCNGAADGSSLINPTATPTPTSTPISGSNVAKITVDSGPSGVSGALNIPYVSVTLCVPGTTTCTTVDHVLVDTGSTGLRIMASALNGVTLPAQNTPASSGSAPVTVPNVPMAECYQFADGYIWGSVAKADITIGGETASGVQLQIIGDSSYPTVPSGCSAGGSNESTVADFGANGVIGLSNIVHDCDTLGACDTTANTAFYYGCSTPSNCQATTMPIANQLVNPATLFATDNNGVMIVMPSVGSTGAASVSGSLVFGIGTASNNALSGVTQYPTNYVGFLYMGIGSTANSSGFFDSGSNIYFLPSTVASACASGSNSAGPDFFCPNTTLSPTVAIAAYNTNRSPSTTVTLSIANATSLFSSGNIAYSNIGGPNSNPGIDLGFPFNYGRSVYVGFNSGSTPGFVAF
ncbi:DUF3443 family protein [Silvimonas amylolytica]|uniref:Lipoprotein n=1 Tax=Silvimonas amylolytica TaxID=449663 RepID=A0ABQ2PLW6_9NEIS|nr:DUF3443 family protein [Silvimonas amylolytica]GGP26259.1 lipoprotein [Silvimonas amylolytica]